MRNAGCFWGVSMLSLKETCVEGRFSLWAFLTGSSAAGQRLRKRRGSPVKRWSSKPPWTASFSRWNSSRTRRSPQPSSAGLRHRAHRQHGLRSLRREGHFHRLHPPRCGAGKHRGHRAAHPHRDRHHRPARPAASPRWLREGQAVKAGTPLLNVDLDAIRAAGLSTESAVIVTNADDLPKLHIIAGRASSPPARRCSNSSKIQKRHLPSADVFFVMLMLFRAYTAGPARRRGR